MKPEESRKEFEAWFVIPGERLKKYLRRTRVGKYKDASVQLAWEAWQAATEAHKSKMQKELSDVLPPANWIPTPDC